MAVVSGELKRKHVDVHAHTDPPWPCSSRETQTGTHGQPDSGVCSAARTGTEVLLRCERRPVECSVLYESCKRVAGLFDLCVTPLIV
jgi:hypothetical protein